MRLARLIRRLVYSPLSPTTVRETADEISYADAVVVSKRDNLKKGTTNLQQMVADCQYVVKLSMVDPLGREFVFELYENKENYDRFESGEIVNVRYKKVHDVTYTLVPPDYEWKVSADVFVMPKFVDVKKKAMNKAA